MLVEVILELLVGIVDAELFKTVPLEVLKPKDVEDPDGQALGGERTVVTAQSSLFCCVVRTLCLGPVIFE